VTRRGFRHVGPGQISGQPFVVVCNSGTGPSGYNFYYTVNGTKLTLAVVGSDDVSVYGQLGGG
jgi:hypothetical protein